MSKFHFFSIAVMFAVTSWSYSGHASESLTAVTVSTPLPTGMAPDEYTRVNNEFQAVALKYEAALKIAELNVSDEIAIADCLAKLGSAYLKLDQFNLTYLHLNRALTIYRRHPPSESYAEALHVLGNMWLERDDGHEAIRALAKSVAIYAQIQGSSRLNFAHTYADLASANIRAGALELAQLHAKSAVLLCEADQSTIAACKGVALERIGDANLQAGDLSAALEIYQKVLAALRVELGVAHIRTVEMQAKVMMARARLAGSFASYEEAIKALQAQFSIHELNYGRVSIEVADTLNKLAWLYEKTQAIDLAIINVERSIRVREKILGPWSTSLVAALINQANILQSSGKHDEVLAPVSRALGLGWDDVSYEEKLAIFDLLSTYAQAVSNPHAAIYFSKRAAEMALTGGRMLRLANQALGRNYVAVRSSIFRNLIANLMQQGRVVEAQDSLDLLKENEYLDYVGDAGKEMRTANLNPFEDEKKHQFNAALGKLVAAQYSWGKEEKRNELALKKMDLHFFHMQEKKIVAMQMEFDAFLKDFFAAFKQEESNADIPPKEDVASAESKLKSLRNLSDTAAMLYYFVDEKQTYILLTTQEGCRLHKIDVASDILQRKVKKFLELAQNPRRDPLPLAKDLYQILIAPIAADLERAKADTLLLSLDGILRHLPIAALHDGKNYLVQKYSLSLLTQSGIGNLTAGDGRALQIGALGLTRSVQGFRALPGVKRELSGIVKQGNRGIFPGEVLLDDAFTEQALQKILSKNYPVLHIASHFIFKPGNDTESFLLLGDGSQLSVNQLKQAKFNFSHTELLTLSACETDAVGKNLNGLAVEGLGAVLQKRGAKSILATKWSVEDQSTAIFMSNFYRNWFRHLTKTQALRLAQRIFIEDKMAATSTQVRQRGAKRLRTDQTAAYLFDPQRPYAHPYYWAGFVLMGNWL